MMSSKKTNSQGNNEEQEIRLIKLNQIESENEADCEENNQTEADSGLHQSIYLLRENEQKNKKTKNFKSFIEKPIAKNFLNGGDFSDFFNNRDCDEENESSGNQNKKFHTVTINKQSSITSQLRGILNNKIKEDEINLDERDNDLDKDEINEMKADMGYNFGPFFGKTKGFNENITNENNCSNNLNHSQNSDESFNTKNEASKKDLSKLESKLDEEINIKNNSKIKYFNSKKKKSICDTNIIKNDNNFHGKDKIDVIVPKIYFNNQKSSFEADFKKLNIDEKLNKEKIYNDPSKVIKKLNLLNENKKITKNNINKYGTEFTGYLGISKDESKTRSSVNKDVSITDIMAESEEESNTRNHTKIIDKQSDLFNHRDKAQNYSKIRNIDNDNINNLNLNHYSNNFPSKDIFNQSILNQSTDNHQINASDSRISFISDDSDQFNSPLINSNCNNNLDLYLKNKNGFNNLLNPGQNNFNPINYYQFLDIKKLMNNGDSISNKEDCNILRTNHQNFNQNLNSINKYSIGGKIDIKNNLNLNENICNSNNSFINLSGNDNNNLGNSNRINAINENSFSNQNYFDNQIVSNINNNIENFKNVNKLNVPINKNSFINCSENIFSNNIPINMPLHLNNNTYTNQYNQKLNYNSNNENTLINSGFNNQKMRNQNLSNNQMNLIANSNNPMFGNLNMFNNSLHNQLNLINNGALLNNINNNLKNEMILKSQILRNNNISNFHVPNNLNNLNNLLILSNYMSNNLENTNNNSNNLLFNNILNFLPILQQMSLVTNLQKEFIQGKDIQNNNSGDNNSKFTMLDNLNELLIRELETILNLSDKIDENVFNKIKNNFIVLLKSQNGSRVFQKYLKNTHPLMMKKIFAHLYPILTDLLMDPYANYFCQKFFVYLEKEDRLEFLKKIEPHILSISKSRIGTYPLQVIIEQINNLNETEIILNAIGNDIMDLSLETYGCHVIEKVVMCFNEDLIGFIYDLSVENFMIMANNANGLCIIKKILIHSSKKETIEKLKKLIVDNCIYLIQNPYGNYTIQIILDHWHQDHFIDLISQFNYKYTNLSMQKYSSNVVEKCLERSPDYGLIKFIEEVSQMNRVADLMKNNYGNYVVQKALKISSGSPKLKLIISILKNIEKIGDKKLISKWKSIVISCLPSEIEMNNADGELIYKLLKLITFEEVPVVNRNSNQVYMNKGNNNFGNRRLSNSNNNHFNNGINNFVENNIFGMVNNNNTNSNNYQ